MDDAERSKIEQVIRDQARAVALALADFPEFAVDIRDELRDSYGISARHELDDFYAIGGADDAQTEPGSSEYRRTRRLAELKLALDELRPSL